MHDTGDDQGDQVVVRGAQYSVEYAICRDGSKPAEVFISGLSPKEQTKLAVLFTRLADTGAISNREQFKKIESPIWEFKRHQSRVFCFRKKDTWYLTNGYKKKDALDPNQVERAQRIMEEHLSR